MAGDYSFEFLNLKKSFAQNSIDWQISDVPKLWRYNLHYFTFLLEDGRALGARDHLIENWIKSNPIGEGDAWEPYTVSVRIVNTIDYFLRTESQRPLEIEWIRILYTQAMWLERNLEHEILANHYLKNGVALFFAGLFFVGKCAERWMAIGLRIFA